MAAFLSFPARLLSAFQIRRFTAADLFLFTTICIWGLNVSIVKALLAHIEPMALTVLRFSMASAVFALILPVTERLPRVRRSSLPLLVAAGACGIWLNQVAFTYSLENTTASNVTLLITTIPIFAAIGSFLLGWERPGWRHWTGIAISVAGVALVVVAAPQVEGHQSNLLGDLLALLMAASWATYSLMLRTLMRAYSAPKISLYVTVVGLVLLLPLGVPQLAGSHLAGLSPWQWLLIAYTSVVAVALTNILWYTGIHRLGPSRATVYSYLQPFVGLIFAVLILGESLAVLQLVGGGLILGGILFGREPQPEVARTE